MHRSRFWSLYIGPHFGFYIGLKSGPRIEGPYSARGSTQVHEGPHRDHGHVLHNAKHDYGPIRVLKGPEGT